MTKACVAFIVAVIAFIVVAIAAPANDAGKREPDVVVRVAQNNAHPGVLKPAESQARSMLEKAGVLVAFRDVRVPYHGTAEVIDVRIDYEKDDSVRPGALAFTTIGAQPGPRIDIFYNRVVRSIQPHLAAPLLAHVLVHEITHALEGTNRHSTTGIMKAIWNGHDWMNIRYRSLPFADEDLRLIHRWVEQHRATFLASDYCLIRYEPDLSAPEASPFMTLRCVGLGF